MKMQRHMESGGKVARFAFLRAVLAVLLLAFAPSCDWTNPNSAKASNGDALTQVLGRGSIRCSYLVYSPYFRKDPNTGELSGIFHDLMEEIGKHSSLKIEWVEEVGYEAIYPGLDAGRYDVFAGGLWPNSTRAKAGLFSEPVFYSVVMAWGRADETRFDTSLDAVNKADVRVACIDGAMEDIIAKTDFPQATRVSLPQLSPFSQNLLNITSGKADMTFAEPGIVAEFLKSNNGGLKLLAKGQALRVFGNSLVIGHAQINLKLYLDVAMKEVLQDGTVERILKKYEPAPNTFPRVAIPYRTVADDGATPKS